MRPLARFAYEIVHFVYDLATLKVLLSEGVAMYAFPYTAHELDKWPWAELFKMNAKIEQDSKFVVDNESHFDT